MTLGFLRGLASFLNNKKILHLRADFHSTLLLLNTPSRVKIIPVF